MKRKLRRNPPTDEPPLRFSHRVEAWISAAYFSIRGVSLLLHALNLQQTRRWSKQRRRVRKALNAFEEAARWTRISQHCPGERPHRHHGERAPEPDVADTTE